MAIKKIIILFESTYPKKDYDRFGIELLSDNGYDVEAWNVLLALYPKTGDLIDEDPFKFPGLKKFNSKQEVASGILKLTDEDIIITSFDYRLKYFWIFRTISKSKCNYACFNIAPGCVDYANHNENIPKLYSFFLKLKDALSNLFKPHAFNSISLYAFKHIPYQFLGIKLPKIIFLGGTPLMLKHKKTPYDPSLTKIVPVHNYDYDLFLRYEKNKIEIKNSNIAVFLDNCLPIHNDDVLHGVEHKAIKEIYYPSCCRFFDYVENELNVEVVIATYPSSVYSDQENLFKGRRLFKGKTIELVSNSNLVINQTSSALNFAILYRKPILFFYTQDMSDSGESKFAKEMAKWVGKTAINSDKHFSINWGNELKVNEKLYSYFEETFIKPKGSPKLPLWQIVNNEINNIQ